MSVSFRDWARANYGATGLGCFPLTRKGTMRTVFRWALAGSVVLLGAGTGVLHAQATYPNVKVTGRLQEQFYYFDNTDYAATVGPKEQLLHPARAHRGAGQHLGERGRVHPALVRGRPEPVERRDHLHLVCRAGRRRDTRPSPAEPPAGAACGSATPGSTCGSRKRASPGAFYLRVGQEKRPYSRYELTSSNNLPSIERGAGQGLIARSIQ